MMTTGTLARPARQGARIFIRQIAGIRHNPAVWPTVWSAVCQHQTRMSIYERLEHLPIDQQVALWGSQEFYRVFSLVNGGRKLETDLFEGLR